MNLKNEVDHIALLVKQQKDINYQNQAEMVRAKLSADGYRLDNELKAKFTAVKNMDADLNMNEQQLIEMSEVSA